MDKILPHLLAWVTGHTRAKVVAGVDFEWSDKSWVHNMFRVYELIFWRRHGPRAESSSWHEYVNGKLVEKHQYFTFEARCAYAETAVRKFLAKIPRFKLVKVYLPIPVLVSGPRFAFAKSPYLFAIALDAAAGSTAITNPMTLSHTCSGSNRYLTVGGYYNPNTTETITTMTYVTGMTKEFELAAGNGVWTTLWDLIAPSTGANTITPTDPGFARPIGLASVSYTGVSQTTPIDSSNTSSGGAGSTSPLDLSTTVVATGCWTWMFVLNWTPTSAGTGSTLRCNGSTNGGGGNDRLTIVDSNGTVGTGSQTLEVTSTGAGSYGAIIISFKIPGAVVTTTPFLTLLMMNVG